MNRETFLRRFLVAVFVVLLTTRAGAFTNYVNLNNATPVAPYTSWATAALTIQDAVDACPAGATVLVTNGLYQTGGRTYQTALTNRVVITNPVTIQSVNGPAFTTIAGKQDPSSTNGPTAIRCVYVTGAATISGFTFTSGATLTNGSTVDEIGGAIYAAGVSNGIQITNCVFTGNSAFVNGGAVYGGALLSCLLQSNVTRLSGTAAYSSLSNCIFTGNYTAGGGGAAYSSAINCIFTNNSATSGGGGATDSYLTNCVIANNSASYGGGCQFCFVLNCTIVNNTATQNGGGDYEAPSPTHHPSGLFNSIILSNTAPAYGNFASPYTQPQFCCTSPTNYGPGNITFDPLFVNAAAGDYRLQSNSPCINSGMTKYVAGTFDLAGNPRVIGGTIDQGAYEFQTPASLLSYSWAVENGLPTDGSADFADPDGDGVNNYAEWLAETDPHDPNVFFKIDGIDNAPPFTTVYFSGFSNRVYTLLTSPTVDTGYVLNGSIAPRTTGPTSMSTGQTQPVIFYRVRVSLP